MSRFIDCFHLISVDKTIRSSFINLLLKPVNLILTLVYTPLLLSYLGDTRYGLWAIILSIILVILVIKINKSIINSILYTITKKNVVYCIYR